MTHHQREALPSGARGTWEWFGPAPQLRPRPSSAPARQLAAQPLAPPSPAVRRAVRRAWGPGSLAGPAAIVTSATAEVLTASTAGHPQRLALRLATLRLHWHLPRRRGGCAEGQPGGSPAVSRPIATPPPAAPAPAAGVEWTHTASCHAFA